MSTAKRLRAAACLLLLAACGSEDSGGLVPMPMQCADGGVMSDGGMCAQASCLDGVQNGDEGGVDCGGSCEPCVEATCRDGVQNGDEEGVDCGGVCRACEPETSCADGVQNGDEEGVDCGGMCSACPTCDDGAQNGDEEGVDCGGSCAACPPMPSCRDGVQNGGEEGIDCGGPCTRCRLSPPDDWACTADAYDDGECDCGCGVRDADCASGSAALCVGSACSMNQRIDPENNASCVAYPEAPANPSFERTPSASGEIPDWTVLRRDGISDVRVVGPAQTTAPDGARALYLTSTYRSGGMFGFPSPVEVASSRFIPSGTSCVLTIAMGDADSAGPFSDHGAITVRALGAPAPLDVLARVLIDTRGGPNSVLPSVDGYDDIELPFAHDGSLPLRIEVLADAGFNTEAFHVDHVRVRCE